jgi:hypothetical protein
MTRSYSLFCFPFILPSHDDLPPSIVRLPVYPDDDTLYNACVPKPQDWGNFKSDGPIEVNLDNILQVADQAGDFTLAHRDTWRHVRGYRETGGVAWYVLCNVR